MRSMERLSPIFAARKPEGSRLFGTQGAPPHYHASEDKVFCPRGEVVALARRRVAQRGSRSCRVQAQALGPHAQEC
jgi:hypothetical protein